MAAATATTTATASPPKPLINFLRGWPHVSLLAADRLSKAATTVLASPELMPDTLFYGPDPGYQPLREELATYISSAFTAHGAPCDPERICITGGASQNIANLMQSFSDPVYTAAVWVCAPCYHLACPIFEDAGFPGRLRAVPEDDEGIDMARLEEGFAATEAEAPASSIKPLKWNLPPTDRKAYRHIVYVVPTSGNPSGQTMTLARREALVRLARRYDALIVCDDVYDFLQWSATGPMPAAVSLPPPLPRLVDVDRTLPYAGADTTQQRRFGNVVSNGSFSKLVGPGVRTGWAEGTAAFAYGLAQTGNSKSGGAPSQLCASMISEMMRSGEFETHLRDVVRPALQRRHRQLTAAIAKHLDEFLQVENGDQPTYGGYFIWLRLRRPDISATELARRAMAAENLVVPPGTMFQVKGDEAAVPFDHHVRFCFAWEDESRLEEGCERLARIFRHWDTEPAAASGAIDNFADDFK